MENGINRGDTEEIRGVAGESGGLMEEREGVTEEKEIASSLFSKSARLCHKSM